MSEVQVLDVDMPTYHATDGWSRSAVVDYFDSEELFKQRYVDKTLAPKDATPSMEFGTMSESIITGRRSYPNPNLLPDKSEILPDQFLTSNGSRNSRAKGYQEFLETYPPDTHWMTPKEVDKHKVAVQKMVDQMKAVNSQVMGHPQSHQLLMGNGFKRQYEPTFVWQDMDLSWKSRPDLIIQVATDQERVCIVDIKTSRHTKMRQFNASVLQFGYDIQGAMAVDAYAKTNGVVPKFCLLVIANTPPYNVETYWLTDKWLEVGRRRQRTFAKRIMSDEPFRSATWGKMVALDPPEYSYSAAQELEDLAA